MRGNEIFTPAWVIEVRKEAIDMARSGSTIRSIASRLDVRYRSLLRSDCLEVQELLEDIREESRAFWEETYGKAARGEAKCESSVLNSLMRARFSDEYGDVKTHNVNMMDAMKAPVLSPVDWDKVFSDERKAT